MRQTISAAIVAIVAATSLAMPAQGRIRHHHRGARLHVPVAAPTTYAPTRRPYSFYPQEIEGGVSGNLPFNNQLRKLSDPLNANGGGG